jgi:hypothetical protein
MADRAKSDVQANGGGRQARKFCGSSWRGILFSLCLVVEVLGRAARRRCAKW